MKLKGSILLGLTSPFGQAWMEALAQIEGFSITKLILPSKGCVWRAQKKMARNAYPVIFKQVERTYERALTWLKSLNLKPASIYIVDDINTPEHYDLFHDEELVLCAAFSQLFDASLLNNMPRWTVNFHPSYLPRCRGAHPVYWTIASREPYGGVSSHIITPELDKGPIIAREKIAFSPDTITYAELFQAIVRRLPALLEQTLAKIGEEDQILDQSASGLVATYFTQDLPAHHKIDWSSPFGTISAQIRAGNALAFTREGMRVFWSHPIFSPSLPFKVKNEAQYSAGVVGHVCADKAWIKLTEGYLVSNYKMAPTSLPARLLNRIGLLVGYSFFKLKTGQKLR